MSRRGSKVFPGLDLENLDSPKIIRDNIYSQTEVTDTVDNASLSAKGRRRKNSITQFNGEMSSGTNAASPRVTASPRTPRSQFQPVQASMITSSPSPRQRRMSRQLSFDQKPINTTNNQTSGSVPPLRRAKSGVDEDASSVVTTPNLTARKSAKKPTRKNSISSRSGKKKVSFRNPVVEPQPEGLPIYYAELENDGGTPLEEEGGRKLRTRLRREDEGTCGTGCVIT